MTDGETLSFCKQTINLPIFKTDFAHFKKRICKVIMKMIIIILVKIYLE